MCGNREFIREFEKLLTDNKIEYSKEIHIPKAVRKQSENGYKYGLEIPLFTIKAEEVVDFLIKVTPTIILLIREWYASRKKEGRILVKTAGGNTIKLDAKDIKKFTYIEKRRKKSPKKSKARKKKRKRT